jgi:Trk-type K+ transport system membrane component
MILEVDTSKKPNDMVLAVILDWLHSYSFSAVFFDLNQQLYVDSNELENHLVNTATRLIMDKQSAVLNQTIH